MKELMIMFAVWCLGCALMGASISLQNPCVAILGGVLCGVYVLTKCK